MQKTSKAERPDKKKRRATIGGWLSESEGAEFAAYASELGIDLAALATILIVRELNCGKLSALVADDSKHRATKGKRISARTSLTELKTRFAEHAKKHGLSSDAATSTVFRAELGERWLGKCLGLRREST